MPPTTSVFYFFLHVLLYFVSVGALVVLFGSALAILVWMLLKFRRLVIRALGGTIEQ